MPTAQQIKGAEMQRRQGDYQGAIAVVQPALEHPLNRYSSWGPDRRVRHLESASVFVGAVRGLVESSNAAPEVAGYLEKQRDTIVTIYRNPQVKEEAKKNNVDTNLLRDEVWYMTTLAKLTGNTEVVSGAIAKLDELIDRLEERSAKAGVIFDKHRLLYQHDSTSDQFDGLTAAFRDATRENTQTKDWQQVAILAVRYGFHAIDQGRFVAIHEAQSVYNIALKEDKNKVKAILDQEATNSYKEKLRRSEWRETIPEGMDYSSLALPIEAQSSA